MAIETAIEANKAILAEEARIQCALLQLGYFAYSVKFQPMNANDGKPNLTIEARGGDDGDEELIGLCKREQDRRTLDRLYEKKGLGRPMGTLP